MAQYSLIGPWFKHSLSSLLTALVRGALFGSVSLVSLVLLATLLQRTIVNNKPCPMIHKRIYDMCRSEDSLSSQLSENPKATPHAIIEKLYKHHGESSRKTSGDEKAKYSCLEQAYECGKWGSKRPSDLFLQIYHDALCTLEKNPMAGIASPSLLGSSGVVPLTIIAPLPDICRHLSNCIVRAEKEIFLATNYWINSRASKLITNALKELSLRAGKRDSRVVVKMIYDRGDPRQVCKNRLKVYPKAANDPKVNLPAPDEIPNIDLDVINYHRPITGTFHSKFMIVDRRIALLQSNNIQDNDNLEMMIRVEGPIVDSIYDHAIASWNIELEPQLPMIHLPASKEGPVSFIPGKAGAAKCENGHPIGGQTEHTNSRRINDDMLKEHTQDDPHYDPNIESEAKRVNTALLPRGSETVVDAVTRHLNIISRPDVTGDAPEWADDNSMTPYILHEAHEPFPMALICREPWGAMNHTSIYTPQNASFLAAINNAKSTILIQTPNLNAEPLLEPLLYAVRRGVEVTCYLCLGYNDAGQLLPFQNGTNEMISKRLYDSLCSKQEKDRLKIYNYVGKDQTRPIHNKFKTRSCHIKLMIVDECVAIQGNGNLDTQSFYHSQETNLLLDSASVCKTWLDAIQRNQNTAQYGAVSPEDGCWHDPETGKLATGSLGVKPGRFSWLRGIVGAVQRVRGVGGF